MPRGAVCPAPSVGAAGLGCRCAPGPGAGTRPPTRCAGARPRDAAARGPGRGGGDGRRLRGEAPPRGSRRRGAGVPQERPRGHRRVRAGCGSGVRSSRGSSRRCHRRGHGDEAVRRRAPSAVRRAGVRLHRPRPAEGATDGRRGPHPPREPAAARGAPGRIPERPGDRDRDRRRGARRQLHRPGEPAARCRRLRVSAPAPGQRHRLDGAGRPDGRRRATADGPGSRANRPSGGTDRRHPHGRGPAVRIGRRGRS